MYHAAVAEHSGARNHNAFQWGGNPPKLHLTMGDLDPHVIHGYVDPLHPTRQMPFRLSQLSFQGSCSIIPIPYDGAASSPPQNCPFPLVGSGPPSSTWLLRPTPPHMPNGISIGQAIFAGYLAVTS